jgi:hypothetical protein
MNVAMESGGRQSLPLAFFMIQTLLRVAGLRHTNRPTQQTLYTTISMGASLHSFILSITMYVN